MLNARLVDVQLPPINKSNRSIRTQGRKETLGIRRSKHETEELKLPLIIRNATFTLDLLPHNCTRFSTENMLEINGYFSV